VSEPAGNAEDLFPAEQLPVPTAQLPREPKGWHKPRKQWIRKNQWAALSDELLTSRKPADRPFKYLTLPGEDLLDIRVLHEVCAKHQILLKFLGFDSKRKTEVNIASDEVMRLSWIHKESQLLPDRVELLATAKSLAFEHAEKFQGFDAINLDFCDSVGGREAGTKGGALDAIRTIIELQTREAAHPWLLFVTSRCDRTSVDQSVRAVLAKILLENMSQSAAFLGRLTGSPFALSHAMLSGEENGTQATGEKEHLFLFGVGFSKWVIKLAVAVWGVKQTYTAGYRVAGQAGQPDMLSLAFRFDRINPSVTDATGLAPPPGKVKAVPVPAKDEMVAAALNEFENLTDVDELLVTNEHLRDQMIAENAALMAQARYDLDAMIAWGKAQFLPSTPS
jgi:hypothetical protein